MTRDLVSYRELVTEIRLLKTELTTSVDELKVCVEKKVSIKDFDTLQVEVKRNSNYRTKAITVVSITTAIITLAGREIWQWFKS